MNLMGVLKEDNFSFYASVLSFWLAWMFVPAWNAVGLSVAILLALLFSRLK